MSKNSLVSWFSWVALFGVSMAFAEAAVVVYLRKIYYPEGFAFPLKFIAEAEILVEVYREIATVLMLIGFSALSGRSLDRRFACFIISFGIWDIFYYVWLKALIDWPATLFDWDILFLIPIPWIGPVIAPASVSLILVIIGMVIVSLHHRGRRLKPSFIAGGIALAGSAVILYSFMHDTGATLRQEFPRPYRYDLLIIGNMLLVMSFVLAYMKSRKEDKSRMQEATPIFKKRNMI
jgi:hypothetical protein